jgi:selenide,water dikinase
VLRGLGSVKDGRLLVGPETLDDAGVVTLGSADGLPDGVQLHLVQTVDFFPPVVDDPWFYGAIAAANSLSDVYAMGGRPLSALTLACFPRDFPDEWLGEVLRGGFEKVREAGAAVVGGHTVDGAIQFGFAVTGVVDPERMTSNDRARPGDRVYLTKPLGMGAVTTAAKVGEIGWDSVEPAARQMATLNAAAAEAMVAAGAHAATDVTGFGLVGHAFNVVKASGVGLRLVAADVPLFPGAIDLARRGLNTGAAKRGQRFLAEDVAVPGELDEALVRLLFDAETSGGLLVFVDPARATDLERELAARDLPVCCVGECTPRGARAIEIT